MKKVTYAAVLAALLVAAPQAKAQDSNSSSPVNLTSNAPDDGSGGSASDLAKKLQNPIGDLYSFPFQSNTNFNYGPNKGTQENLNIQPVIPIHINKDWNVIVRAILPLIWQPSLEPAHTVPFGTGPTVLSGFLSPANPYHGWVWGVGAAA